MKPETVLTASFLIRLDQAITSKKAREQTSAAKAMAVLSVSQAMIFAIDWHQRGSDVSMPTLQLILDHCQASLIEHDMERHWPEAEKYLRTEADKIHGAFGIELDEKMRMVMRDVLLAREEIE